MGGVFRAIGKAVSGVARGIGSVVGGVVHGVGKLFQGKPLEALGSVVGGVVKGAGSVIKGGLGAVKDVLGDPIITRVAGFATGGLFGSVVGPMIGNIGSKIVGGLESAVGSLTGNNDDEAQRTMMYNQNANAFGPMNAMLASGGLGQPMGGLFPGALGLAPGLQGFF